MSEDAWAMLGFFVIIGGMICYWEWLFHKGKGNPENISDTSHPGDFHIDL